MFKNSFPLFTVLVFLVSFSSSTCFAGGAKFAWVGQIEVEFKSMKIDRQNNVCAVGTFMGTKDFDPGPGVTTLTSSSTLSSRPDVFIVKYNTNGQLIWVKQIHTGTPENNACQDLYIDSNSNIYFTGGFDWTRDFDPGVGSYTMNHPSNSSWATAGYLAKLDSAGNFVSAKKISGQLGIKFTSHNNAHFYLLNNYKIEKYSASGSMVWAKPAIGGRHIAVDAAENFYIGGNFRQTVDFDPGPNVSSLTAVNVFDLNGDMFLLKLDSNCDFQWVKQYSAYNNWANQFIVMNDLKINSSGKAILSGHYRGRIDVDPNAGISYLSNVISFSTGITTGFLLGMNANGALSWASGYSNNLGNYEIAIEPTTDNIIVAGDAGNYYYPNGNQVHISKTNSQGVLIWQKNAESNHYASAYKMAMDDAGNIYSHGRYTDTIDFDPSPLATSYLYGSPTTNLNYFIHKLDACPATTGTLNVSACDSFNLLGVSYTQTGTYNLVLPSSTGCDSFLTLQLNIKETPVATAYISANVLIGNYSTIVPVPASAVSLQWINCATKQPIAGETSANFTPTQSGTYAIVVTNSGLCSDTSNCVNYTAVGLDDLSASALKIYPNPAKNILQISYKNSTDEFMTTIYSLEGKIVFNGETVNQKIDVSALAAGAYILSVQKDGTRLRTKLIID